ncbi:MAG: MogA/MoaB family molybdenum cofactor biosynthesis protein [bacterium]|nr:MogA/MoaB family molybdenum cofactor biosynthesis protein [bacterium]
MRRVTVGVVVVSDRAAAGVREDACAAAVAGALPRRAAAVVATAIVPDEIAAIRRAVRAMADRKGVDVILTAGGTGIGPRDVTPEAIGPLLDRLLPGIGECMRMRSVRSVPTAVLSRALAGTRGGSIVVALPGSPRGAAACLSHVWPALPHAVEILRGRAVECAARAARRPAGRRRR